MLKQIILWIFRGIEFISRRYSLALLSIVSEIRTLDVIFHSMLFSQNFREHISIDLTLTFSYYSRFQNLPVYFLLTTRAIKICSTRCRNHFSLKQKCKRMFYFHICASNVETIRLSRSFIQPSI